jgi:hypothetical protein
MRMDYQLKTFLPYQWITRYVLFRQTELRLLYNPERHGVREPGH